MELKRLKNKIIKLQQKFVDAQGLDKSIFLQNAVIFKTLVEIVDDIKDMVAEVGEDGKLDRLEDMLLYRNIKTSFNELYDTIKGMSDEALKKLGEHRDIAWIEKNSIETYIKNNHAAGRTEFSKEYLEETNNSSLSAREKTFTAINNIVQVEMHELAQGKIMLDKIQFDEEVFKQKIVTGVRQYSNKKNIKVYEKLRREAEKFKDESFTLLTPRIWGKALENEKNALTMAVNGELTSFIDKDGLYEGFSPEQCKLMEDNGSLMEKIISVGRAEDLFSFEYDKDDKEYYFSLLNADNIDLFYYLILRHNIIWCETFTDLKDRYREWLNADDVETLSEKDKVLLNRLLNYVEKADWQNPANSENIKVFITKLFENRDFRDFFKEGRGAKTDREEVSMANILGYLKRCNLLAGTPTSISKDVFGNDQVNNINKGINLDGNQNFKELLPLMDKHRQELIV